MTKEGLRTLLDELDDTQKAKVEKIFQRKRDQLFKWYDEEWTKVCEKLKEEGRHRTGLDANNDQPEVRELSAEYNRRFCALPGESICELLEQNA